MKHHNTVAILALCALTLCVAWAAKTSMPLLQGALLVLGLSAIKFLLVAFQFMELRHAHPFWQGLVVLFVLSFWVTAWILLGNFSG